MSARTPRRSFATPFVITLAAAPACWTNANTPPTAHAPDPDDPAQHVQTAPPPVDNDGKTWTLIRQGDGCAAVEDISCPQGASCNPPPPTPYPCPPNMEAGAGPQHIVADGGKCTLEHPMPACPPHAMCNPPRPVPTKCPDAP